VDSQTIDEIAPLLRRASAVLFITGAGISAESGLPTYRGIGGLYDRAETEEGIPIEAALSGHMMMMNPALCWKYIAEIERACRGARHNRAHDILAEVERRLPRVWVLTQNVDGFHRDAGSLNLIEIHGNVRALLCTRCPWRSVVANYAALAIPPRCPGCAGLVRPDVVLFGEMLPPDQVGRMHDALSPGFDIVFSIGTTSVFPYIAQPVRDAHRAGVPTVEINLGESEISGIVDFRVRAGALAALEAIWQRACTG
jgi:NAD-dependent deacetylase